MIVGQIHGSDAISSIPFVLLHDDNGQIGVAVKQARSGSASTNLSLLDNVPLGTLFGYTITDNGDDTLTFTATSAGHTATATARIPPTFIGATVRFQAGLISKRLHHRRLRTRRWRPRHLPRPHRHLTRPPAPCPTSPLR